MRIQNAFDNAANFLIHPADVQGTPCQQRAAWPVTIVVFILTLGIVHSLSLLWLKLRKVEPQPGHQKIQEVFDRNRPSATPSNPTTSSGRSTPIDPISTEEGTAEIVPNLPIPPGDRIALFNYIRTHHYNQASEKILIRALGEEWFVWYDELKNVIMIRSLLSFSTSSTERLELSISSEGDFSIRNYTASTVLSEDYARLIQRLEEEVSTLRLIRGESSSPAPTERPIDHRVFTRPQSVTSPIFPYPQIIGSRLNPTPVFNPDTKSEAPPTNNNAASESSLAFTQEELSETQDQPFPSVDSLDEPCKLSCPRDWTLFKSILEKNGSYECNLGSRGIFNVSRRHGEDLIVISSRDTSNPLKIKILLNSKSEFSSFTINDQPVRTKFIPKEYFPILNGCFKRVLEMSAEYKFTGRSHHIKIPIRSLAKIPEVNLLRFYEQLHFVHEFKVSVETRITFFNDDYEEEDGVDAGGLTRQFFEEVMKNILQSKKLNFFKCHNELFLPFTKGSSDNVSSFQIPSLTAQENKLYNMLGYLMGYVYNTDSVKTGYYFDESLFNAILAFTPEELTQPFNTVTEETCIRVAESLINPRKEAVGESDLLHRLLKCIRLIRTASTSNEELKNALIFAGVPNLPDFPSRFVTDEQLNMSEISAHKEEFVKVLYKAILDFPDTNYGPIRNQISAIHAFGTGINTLFNLLDTPWSSVKNCSYQIFANKIQGNIDRNKIVERIRVTDNSKLLLTKAQWLMEWIQDPNTSDKDIRLFLKFVTGATSLTNDGHSIEIRPDYSNKLLFPSAHTCGYQFDMPIMFKTWKTSSGERYTDTTKEGFIKILKDFVLKEDNMFFANS